MKKLFILTAAVMLLAAGCSRSNQQVQAPPPGAPVISTANRAPEQDPLEGWIRYYPNETLKFNLLFPLAWWGDEGGTDTHFVLRSRQNADGSRPDDVIMDFSLVPLTTKTLADQVTTNVRGAKDLSPVVSSKTDSGVPYAFAALIDSAGKPAMNVVVQYGGEQYIRIKITGNITLPYVGRMIQSITLNR